jgi:hypothetical protein
VKLGLVVYPIMRLRSDAAAGSASSHLRND